MSTLNAVSIRPQQDDSPLKVTNGEIDRNMKYLANIQFSTLYYKRF